MMSSKRSGWLKLKADFYFLPVPPKFYMVDTKFVILSLIAQNRRAEGITFSDISLHGVER